MIAQNAMAVANRKKMIKYLFLGGSFSVTKKTIKGRNKPHKVLFWKIRG